MHTEEVICQVQEADAADVDLAVAAAKKAFELGSVWRTMAGSGRRCVSGCGNPALGNQAVAVCSGD